MQGDPTTNPQVVLTSDASGSWGCGAFVGQQWFMLPWAGPVQESHITVKELAPIVVAALVLGQDWRGKTVLAHCDNSAAVAIVNMGFSRNPQAMPFRRCLTYLAAVKDFVIKATHIPGVDNTAADALSRNDLPSFHSCCPQAEELGTMIPQEVLDSILLGEPD